MLLGGVASDRLERKKVIIVADVVRALAAGAIGVLAISGDLELWHLCVMAAVFGLGQAFAGPAFGSIVPQLVPDDLLVQANSALFTVNPLAFLFVGPALGGFAIAAAGTGVAFLLDAASFAVGAVAIALLAARPAARVLERGRTAHDRPGHPRELPLRPSAGLALGHAALGAARASRWPGAPYVVLLPYFVKNELGGDAQDLGLVFAAGGASSVLMALLISQVGLPRRHIAFMFAAFGLGAVDLAIYALTSATWQAMVVAFVASCGWTGGIVAWNTLLQRNVPAEILGPGAEPRLAGRDRAGAVLLRDRRAARRVGRGQAGHGRLRRPGRDLHRCRLPAPGHAQHRKSTLALARDDPSGVWSFPPW